jgi:hypothetical protein
MVKPRPAVSVVSDAGQPAPAFDLNIEKVLEHWPVAFAVREFIANALDEAAITGTAEPTISADGDGGWRIRDFGRGLSYEHLTQKENLEKLKHPSVIGQFGIGLKDALAVCDRRNVCVLLRSRHGDITTVRRAKAGFADIVTLHGLVSPPADPNLDGTEVLLSGVSAADIETAKKFFLLYSGDRLLEHTKFGDVLAPASTKEGGRIYVKGLLVAMEPNFLFSYNITQLNATLRRALNRERSNVGRSAYSDRVKDILKECRSPDVALPLTADLGRYSSGKMHDELAWKDVAIHACRVLQSQEKVVFISVWQTGSVEVGYARDEGYRPVVVPDDIANALGRLKDLDGQPMFDLDRFRQSWNESFNFTFVNPEELTASERAVFELTERATRLAKIAPARHGVNEVRISETMRINERGAQVVGVWDRANNRVVIRRDQLEHSAAYCGTLLHELEHAASSCSDGTLEFEDALTSRLGVAVSEALRQTA